MTKDDAAYGKLRWHPAFLQAMQLELFDYRDSLEFRQEYQLTSEPLRIDLLIIKKPKELVIDKNIARIFRTDNVVEYKSPEDNLSIKGFWKIYAYANLYAAITPGVELSNVTLTFVGSRHPRKLLRYLTGDRGYTVEETSPGIYLVTGDYLPIQIIESGKLSEDENLWLQSLREDVLNESDLDVILEEGKKLGQEINIDAYLDVIFRANQKAVKEGDQMKKYPSLETVLIEGGFGPRLVEYAKAQGLKKGLETGKEQGLEKGKEIIARNLLKMGMPIEDIAQAVELPVEKIRAFEDNI